MIIRTDKDRQAFFDRASTIDLSKSVWVFTADKYKVDRSAAQNSLYYAFLASIGKQSGEGMQAERNKYKFEIGCNILITDGKNPEFDKFYDKLINTYTYEECVDAMAFISVSSLMKVGQMAEFISEIERSAFNRGFHLARTEDYILAMKVV